MTEASQGGALSDFFRMPRFAPALFAGFLCGLLLLFLRDLPEIIRSVFLPSLVVYAQGTALLGALHRMLGIHFQTSDYGDNEKPIPIAWKIGILAGHLLWFIAFIGYNMAKSVL